MVFGGVEVGGGEWVKRLGEGTEKGGKRRSGERKMERGKKKEGLLFFFSWRGLRRIAGVYG